MKEKYKFVYRQKNKDNKYKYLNQSVYKLVINYNNIFEY